MITSIPIISGGSGYSEDDLVNVFDLQNEQYAGSGAKVVPVVDSEGVVQELKILDGGQIISLVICMFL